MQRFSGSFCPKGVMIVFLSDLTHSTPATSILLAADHQFLTNYKNTRIEQVLTKSMFLFGTDTHTVQFVSFNHFLDKSARVQTHTFSLLSRSFMDFERDFCGDGEHTADAHCSRSVRVHDEL